ncbi:UDP-glucose 6-dehydrogenase [hydrothermal vent metagenome]|uniref:UDP-glucose 6-dehydrogenase n=1 Tax=hydrothermal vent metagenome TaxID=652676 RepID=A0A3B0Y876_9ZZZZ
MAHKIMKVTIFGSGYVGLVTGACLAQVGNDVLCVDIDQNRIDSLLKGHIPIYEPGLEPLVLSNLKAKRLTFTSAMQKAVHHGDIQFIAVGTPPDESGSADLQYVLAAAKTIGQYMDRDLVVVDKSTVPVGTADKVHTMIEQQLTQRSLDFNFDVASNPEFLKEGNAIADFMKPDRIVIGVSQDKTVKILSDLYSPFNRSRERLIVMDVRSAELTKYAANAMLATKISFMNEMANLAEALGADIEKVRIGIGSDPRISYHYIYPGCGYGGSCFPKDVQAIEKMGEQVGIDTQLTRAVRDVNQKQKTVLFNKLNQYFNNKLTGKTIALWGLAFKPNTDDMRDASSRVLMELLWEAGATVQAFDPVAMNEVKRIYGERSDLVLCDNANAALSNADALVVVTEWSEFRSPDFDYIKTTLNQPVIFDGRNLYDPQLMSEAGFNYYAIGRGESIKQS